MRKVVIGAIVIILLAFITAVIFVATNNFTIAPKTFAIVYEDKRILNDKSELKFSTGDTLELKPYGDDAEIDVTITMLKVYGDYMFEIGDREYSWNNDVVLSKNAYKYLNVLVAIDQEQNTIKIVNGIRDMLEAYATGEGVEGEVKLINPLPQEDMFVLAVTTGDNTINLSCMLYSAVSGISLDAKA